MERTNSVIQTLAKTYEGASNVVVAIAPLNELVLAANLDHAMTFRWIGLPAMMEPKSWTLWNKYVVLLLKRPSSDDPVKYWYSSYQNIRYILSLCCVLSEPITSNRYPSGGSQESNTVVVLHDAFQSPSYWNGFMPPPNYEGVLMDTHIYQMFTQQVSTHSNMIFTGSLTEN